jgi:uncharacterized protein GlcG (DUF336 family)
MSLTLDAAQTILTGTLAKARELGLKPLCVTVLDAAGATKALAREDGSSLMRPKIAHGKAYGAIAMGLGSRALWRRAEEQAYFMQAMNTLADGALVPVSGGVLIRSGGEIVGAVGVTGDSSDNDEICAVAGVKAAGLEADPG